MFAELAEDEELYGFKIVFHGQGNRSYALASDSQESMEQWMKALACAPYDYMKLMVAELQRQLDQMDGKLVLFFPYILVHRFFYYFFLLMLRNFFYFC